MSDDTVSGTGTPAGEVVYENTADQVWTDKALDLYRQRKLQVAAFNTEGVVSAQIWGPCPRCGHHINVAPTLIIVVPGQRRGWWAALTGRAAPGGDGIPPSVEVGCGCGCAHPGAPERSDAPGKVPGCGVSFRLPTAPPGASPGVSAAPVDPLDPR